MGSIHLTNWQAKLYKQVEDAPALRHYDCSLFSLPYNTSRFQALKPRMDNRVYESCIGVLLN